MTETSRSGVHEHRDLARLEPVCIGSGGVEDLVDALHLDEVVAGAHRPELSRAALPSALRYRGRVLAFEPPLRLRALDVLCPVRDDAPAVA